MSTNMFTNGKFFLQDYDILSGGHGYGLRNTGHTVNEWPFRVLSWLRDIGMIKK